MGGAGKTQLALEICRQAEEHLSFQAVIWIDALSPVSVMQSYKVIAKNILNSSQDNAKDEDIVCSVKDTLRAFKGPWLVVFDNYDTPKAFQEYSIRNYIPGGRNGRILFTSRHEDSARLGYSIDISKMSEEESLELLLQRKPLNEEERFHGHGITSLLGYLALALDQASAYISARKLPLKQFKQEYLERKETILKEIPDEWEYRRSTNDEEKEKVLSVFTTWELSFEQISGSHTDKDRKEHLLTLAAFFDTTLISERYFQAHFELNKPKWMRIFSLENKWTSAKLGDVLAEFQRHSLLQILDKRTKELYFSIHPVVRDWIKLRKSRHVQGKFAEESIIVLSKYLRGVDLDDLSLETIQETISHIDVCVQNDRHLLVGLSTVGIDCHSRSASLFADVYYVQRRFDEAEKLLNRARIRREETLGLKHPDTLQVMHKLAIVYSTQDWYDEAEKWYDQILTEYEKILGAKDPDTLIVMHNLAFVYSKQSKYDKAEELYRQVLNVQEERLDVRHLDILKTMHSLAIVYHDQDQYDKAEELYRQALNGQEERLGIKHSDTLTTMQNLAVSYHDQSQYDKAKELYKQALNGQKERLGVKHPDTLRTMHNLAVHYHKQSKHDKAEKLCRQALNGLEEKLGIKHPDTLRTMHNLAVHYHKQSKHDKAEKLCRQALNGLEEKLGIKHPDTLTTMQNLAVFYHDQSQYDKAEELYRQVLNGQEEKLDVKHPDTLTTMQNLAALYHKQSQYDKAEELYKQALNGQEERLGIKHSDTLLTAENLAKLYRAQGRHDKAEELLKKYPLTSSSS